MHITSINEKVASKTFEKQNLHLLLYTKQREEYVKILLISSAVTLFTIMCTPDNRRANPTRCTHYNTYTGSCCYHIIRASREVMIRNFCTRKIL